MDCLAPLVVAACIAIFFTVCVVCTHLNASPYFTVRRTKLSVDTDWTYDVYYRYPKLFGWTNFSHGNFSTIEIAKAYIKTYDQFPKTEWYKDFWTDGSERRIGAYM
jgi:hypothetical protein